MPQDAAAARYGGLGAGAWRWIGALALIALAAALPFAVSNYHVFELTLVMIYAIAVLGLNILTGYNGQISLGHGGFFAAGAYTAAILMHRYGVPYWATLPPAGLVCFALGVLFGLPALRFEGPYLALVTLAMAVATPQLLKYFDTWTGGQQGINLAKVQPPPGLGIDRDRWLYLVVLVVLLLGDAGRRQHAQWPHRAGFCRDPRPSDRGGRHGHRCRPLQDARLRHQYGADRHRRRAVRHRHRLCRTRKLQPVPVAVFPGRLRGRRHCDDQRRDCRWLVHRIRAQPRQRHFRRRPMGDLWAGDAAAHVRDAARRGRLGRAFAAAISVAPRFEK